MRLRRRPLIVCTVAVILVLAFFGWGTLSDASALTTSYTRLVPERESIAVDLYETLAGLAFYRSTAERLTAGKSDHRERLAVLMQWSHENVRPQFAAPTRVVADNFIDIVRRGYGYCDQGAHVFASLARLADYDVRLLFLRAPDGVSPHTVVEVLVEGKWILVDPWLGTLVLDQGGQLAGIADLGVTARVPEGYQLVGATIDESYFERGTPFRTFPYQDAAEFFSKVWGKIRAEPVVDVPDDSARRAVAAQSDGLDPYEGFQTVEQVDLETALLMMDDARWAHLEGRYEEAVAAYKRLLGYSLPPDMTQSLGFFLGLALLRDGSVADAVAAFDNALELAPATEWTPSILFYRAEAKERLGDMNGAREDLRASNIPPARSRLARLGSS